MANSIIEKLINKEIPVDFSWNAELHNKTKILLNIPAEPTISQIQNLEIVSDDLRDGLHGVSEYPKPSEMLRYLVKLKSLGIKRAIVGIYPGEKNKIDRAIRTLLSGMAKKTPTITPIVLCLATENSVRWVAELKKIHPDIQALVFMGSAPSRLMVEEWEPEYVINKLSQAIKMCVDEYNIEVIAATEHTTQTPPEFLEKIIIAAIENGAKSFCIADTIGIARPIGTYRLVTFVKNILKEIGAEDIPLEWHGHRDLGNDTANTLTAIASGVQRVHTVARGIGERAGNTPLENILLNCHLILQENNLKSKWKLEKLMGVLRAYNKLVNVSPPSHGPLAERFGATSLGIHTAAIYKAKMLSANANGLELKELAKKLDRMSRQIYSAVDPNTVGETTIAYVGPWSSVNSVRLAYLLMGKDPNTLTEEKVNKVLETAKNLERELTKNELIKLLG
ncbi:MAG: hypothetical protein ABIJ36_01805 [Patescibacteria group bacterium]